MNPKIGNLPKLFNDAMRQKGGEYLKLTQKDSMEFLRLYFENLQNDLMKITK